MNKATRAQVKQHNRRLVMRALYENLADNRAALAIATGLTKPTIGTIISELIDTGYVTEVGYGSSSSSGGKRPTIVEFLQQARQVIGVSVSGDEIIAGLAYLDGTVIARHNSVISPGDNILDVLRWTVNALMAQHDADVLCIAIGVPGVVDSQTGIVVDSRILHWEAMPLAREISKQYRIPCYVSNNTELVTRMQVTQSDHDTSHLVTVSIGDSIEIGSTFGDDVYQHGSDISKLEIPGTDYTVEFLVWKHIKEKMKAIIASNPDSALSERKLTYLLLRRAVLMKEPAALELLDEMATVLSHVYGWIIGLMRPTEIVLAGTMSEIGHVLLTEVDKKLRQRMPAATMAQLRLTLAQSQYLSMQGAVIFALQQELGIV